MASFVPLARSRSAPMPSSIVIPPAALRLGCLFRFASTTSHRPDESAPGPTEVPPIDIRQHTARCLCREMRGVVVSAGLMAKTVKVRVGGQKWNATLQKTFHAPRSLMVHDPNSSLRLGDVVSISSGWKTSRHKHHVVRQILKPSGPSIEERPPVLTEEQLLNTWFQKRKDKDGRRSVLAAQKLEERARRARQKEEDRAEKAQKAAAAVDWRKQNLLSDRSRAAEESKIT